MSLCRCTVVLLVGASLIAEDALAPLGLSDGELALFADLPVVISGSRREESILRSPVPISAIGQDQIRYGIAMSMGDLLIFTPGMDVVRVDRSHEMIGVRGLHDLFSDRTLTLVDGIIADHPIYGGSDFSRLPINTLDLAAIEVVRGPGGAAWGANAFNGVINVRTHEPEDRLGSTAALGVSGFGDVDAQARWADFSGPLSWRMSVGYNDLVSSRDALDDNAANANDWMRAAKTDTGLSYAWTATTTVDVHLGYAHIDQGENVLLGLSTGQDVEKDTLRGDIGLVQVITDDAQLSLRAYSNIYDTADPALMSSRTLEQGGIAQVDLADVGAHTLSFGSDARWTHISDRDPTADRFHPLQNPTVEYRGGIFCIDRWAWSERFTLETQVRGDYYNATGSDWSGRIAGLYSLDTERPQVLRLALARAHRTPLSAIHGVTLDTAFIAPGVPLVTYRPTDAGNEHTASVEAGWQASPWDGGALRLDGYLQHYQDLIGYDITLTPTGFPGLSTTNIRPQTLGDASAHGIEAEITQHHDHGHLSLWYAWNAFATDPVDTSIRAFEPAEHKVGTTSQWHLPWHLIGIINYRYGSSHDAPGTTRTVPGSHRLDLALTWAWPPTHSEITLGVQDALDDTPNGVSLFTADNGPQPGRMVYLRAFASF